MGRHYKVYIVMSLIIVTCTFFLFACSVSTANNEINSQSIEIESVDSVESDEIIPARFSCSFYHHGNELLYSYVAIKGTELNDFLDWICSNEYYKLYRIIPYENTYTVIFQKVDSI